MTNMNILDSKMFDLNGNQISVTLLWSLLWLLLGYSLISGNTPYLKDRTEICVAI